MTSNRLDLKAKFKFVFKAGLLAVFFAASTASAQTTQFTYQGKLTDNGAPINALYDFVFTLWDAPTNGNQIGSQVTVQNNAVVDGIFTVTLDFGVGAFSGASRFLEISVKPNGNPGSPTLLSPRQQVLSTPYAIKSLGSSSADGLSANCVNCITSNQIGSVNGSAIIGGISGSAISGPIPVASVPAGSTNYIQNTTIQQASSNFNISGNGTAGGTLSGDIISASTQYNLGGFRILTFGPSAGNFNLFAGVNAGQSNTGFSNSFFGQNAGLSNSSGGDNSFFGANAGQSNTTGFNNSFFGHQAGINNISGSKNTFIGQAAGNLNAGGTGNIFVGYLAGFNNTTGNNNVFIGAPVSANIQNTTGSNNTTLGSDADVTLSNLNFATAIGSGAKVSTSNTIALGRPNGVDKVVIYGDGISFSTLSGNVVNTAIQYDVNGVRILGNQGFLNLFAGVNSGLNNAGGQNNAFFGASSGNLNVNGNGNSFFGSAAGLNNSSGNGNAFFGQATGATNTSGSKNTLIGVLADANPGTLTNATAIGANALVAQSNSLVLGSIAGINSANADTNVGIGTTQPSERLTIKTATNSFGIVHTDGTAIIGSYVGGGGAQPYGGWIGTRTIHPLIFFAGNSGPAMILETAGFLALNNIDTGGSLQLCQGPNNHVSSCSSSLRYKTDVQSFTGGLDIINRLRPISFSWKQGGVRDLGFGAEEVERIEPLLTFRNKQGEIEGVKYGQISAVLVNAVKEQQAQIASQQEQLKKQQSEIALLKRLVYRRLSKTNNRRSSSTRVVP